jgi:hypothetical protein
MAMRHSPRRFEMAKPIYVMWRARPKAALLQLSKEERAQFAAKHMERHEKAGVKLVITLDTYWSTEKWYWAGVWEIEDIDALQEFERMQQEAKLSLYMTSEIMLGTKWERP